MADHEKRRAPRKPHNSVIEIYHATGDEIAFTARLVDYSKVGACFSCTQNIPINTELRMRVRLLSEGRLYIRGRIVWAKKEANRILYGFQFIKVHEVA